MTQSVIAAVFLGGGALTGDALHEAMGSPKFDYSTPKSATGMCFVDSTNATTGETYDRPFYACAPSHSPEGAEVETVWEDGSATYVGVDTMFDPEEGRFRQLHQN